MAAGGSNLFTGAFGNMRQYMQEHQFQKPPRRQMPGLTAVDLQLAPPTAVTDGPVETGDRTIQLFPRSPVIVPQLTKNLPELQEKSQLAILYQGKGRAFDNFPADKAMALMMMAETWSVSHAPPKSGSPAGTGLLKRAADLPLELLDMQVRRMASVQRFLDTKQYRIPGNYAGEKEPVDLKAIHDETPASWLHF